MQFQSATLKNGVHGIRTGATADEIKQRIVGKSADMFTTAKRVYTSFSSIRRPSDAFVAEQFKDLEKEGLGVVVTIHRSIIFFKRVPESFTNEYKLGKHNISVLEYKQLFETADEFFEQSQRLEMESRYPWKEEARRWNYLQDP